MKKIIQVGYSNRFTDNDDKIKFFLVDVIEGLEKLKEQEEALYGNYFILTFTEFAVEVAKFLTVDHFMGTEMIEFINIMDFIKFNEKL